MVGIKRKDPPGAKSSGGKSSKKHKIEASQSKIPEGLVKVQETETDSDPIVESDTTEHSGDDDGVSWPSDNGEDAAEFSPPEKKSHNEKPAQTTEGGGEKKPRPNNNGKLSRYTNSHGEQQAKITSASSSKESHAKQKVAAQERKAAKPNADSIARSKKIWERLRRKSHVPLAERKELVTELFEIISGRVKEFVLKHDSVRVIQTALKYANIDQRKMIARELKGEYKGLAESRYAKFLIGKLLVHGDEEIRDTVVAEFYGHVRQMIKHPEAAWILDDVYRGIATPMQKASLLSEWYGAEFAIFKNGGGEVSPSADLRYILQEHPEKRTPIMRSLFELINGLIQKKSTGFTMLHDAMLQYYMNLQPENPETTELLELIKGDEEGDFLKNLAFTKSGAHIVCLALVHGNAKDRKQILKVYKTLIQTLAADPYGHQVLLTVYDVIDDTKLTSKSVFPELTGNDSPQSGNEPHPLLGSVTHLNARIALLYPFCGSSKALITKEDLELLGEIHKLRTKTSKKDPAIRRKELVTALSPPLLSFITSDAETLVQTSFGCQFITEVLLGAVGDRDPALQAIASLVHSSTDEVKASLHTPAAGRMLKSLVLGGHFNPEAKTIDLTEPPLGFHNILYENIKDDILTWATGANSFVVLGLVEANGFAEVDALKTALKKEKKKLLKAAGEGGGQIDTTTPPSGRNSSNKGKKSVSRNAEKAKKGNRGTQLLLSKLDE